MFLIAAGVYEALLALVRDAAPSIACGLLVGGDQGRISGIVPIGNRSSTPSRSWQLDPQQLAVELGRILRDGLRLQGIYYVNPGESPEPTAEIRGGWRYNVPCFVVS